MHISLTETLDKYVRDQVATGLYNNASEVIREALRLKIAADNREAARLEALKAAIEDGEASAEAEGWVEYHPGLLDEMLAELAGGKHAAE